MSAYEIADRVAKAAGFQGLLRPGAIVRLKSGGPPMTIAVFDVTDGLVYCHYFFRGRTGQARYSPEMLEPCEPARLESFVPPTNPGPNAYHEASGASLVRVARQDSPESRANQEASARASREPARKTRASIKALLRQARAAGEKAGGEIRAPRQDSPESRANEQPPIRASREVSEDTELPHQ
jgi:uncharacterized protein YodC (DUF2158 family)